MSKGLLIICIILALALDKEKQEYLGICVAIALPIAGIVGGISGGNSSAFNITFWIIFLALASLLLFEDIYMKIFDFIKQKLKR